MQKWVVLLLSQRWRQHQRMSLAHARCLKITEKVSYNIASEARYVYILSWQKLIKNAKNDQFLQVFVCGQTVLPDRSVLVGQKLVENAKIKNWNVTFWVIYQTMCRRRRDRKWEKYLSWASCLSSCVLLWEARFLTFLRLLNFAIVALRSL